MKDNCVPMEMFGVRLRTPRKSTDLETVFAGMGNPQVRQFLQNVLPVYEEEEQEWFEKMKERRHTDLIFSVDLKEGERWRYVGSMGLHRISHIDGTASTGTAIWDPKDWGKGIGKKAKMLLLNYAFAGLNLRKICSDAVAFNERSIRYSLSCGYKEEGRLRQQIYRNGQYYDKVLLAIFREDFEPLWQGFLKTDFLVQGDKG